MSDAWHRRLANIGEASESSVVDTTTFVETPLPKPSSPRQRSVSQLLVNPINEFHYYDKSFGWINYTLVGHNGDAVCYEVTVKDQSNELVLRWTTLAWVFKRRCEHHTELINQYNLSSPERIIHTNSIFTSSYARLRGNLDYILNGFKENFGITPYSEL